MMPIELFHINVLDKPICNRMCVWQVLISPFFQIIVLCANSEDPDQTPRPARLI